jgi:hypothetical protein
MNIQFSKIPVGARFEFRGHRYEKLALSMACDEERLGNIFHAETEVVVEKSQTEASEFKTRAANESGSRFMPHVLR